MNSRIFPYYKLDENYNVIHCNSIEEWAIYFESKKRHLFKSTYKNVYVSTVFLGIDHAFDESSSPLVFESMVFNKDVDLDQDRYSTYKEAAQGHIDLCNKYGIYYTNVSKETPISDFNDLG